MFTKEVSVPRKHGPPVRYLQIVESVRGEGPHPRHQVILNLGRADRLDKERIRDLVRLLSRHLEDDLEHPLPEGIEVGQIRELGIPWLVERLWERLGLDGFFRAELRGRKAALALERALLGMAGHRVQDPTSKLADFCWLREEAFWPWAAKVELHHLYRSLDFLEEHRESLEAALCAHRRNLFNQSADLIYFDTTTVGFDLEEDPEEPPIEGLRQFGRPKDGRISHRQMVVGMAVDPDGLPLLSHCFPGNTVDVQTVDPVVERLHALGIRDIVFVADRGVLSAANLEAIRQAGLHYIVGVRLRQSGELMPTILADTAPYEELESGLQVKRIEREGRFWVVCYAPQSAERDVKLRGRALERLNDKLAHLKKARDRNRAEAEILSHRLFRRWVSRDQSGHLALSREQVAAESACDGTFVLETSDPGLSAARVALGYKGLIRVELGWRCLKHALDIQPVYLRKDERIEAHVALCMVAYLLERWAELRSGLSFTEIRRLLRPLHATELTHHGTSIWKHSRMSKAQTSFFQKLQVPEPPTVLSAQHLPALAEGETDSDL